VLKLSIRVFIIVLNYIPDQKLDYMSIGNIPVYWCTQGWIGCYNAGIVNFLDISQIGARKAGLV
jgi:hypothetical protein